MAKKTTTSSPAAGGGGNKKNNSAGKRRTMGDLMGSEKGKIIMVIRGSAGLANKNGQAGLTVKGANQAEKAKNLAGRLNSVVKPNGKIDTMDTASDLYKKLKSNASAALGSLKKSEYSASVKSLLTFVLDELNSGTGGGARGFNAANFADISL